MTRTEFRNRIADVQHRLEHGCSENGCRYSTRKGGLGTNSRCRCDPRDFREMLDAISAEMNEGDTFRWEPETKEAK